MKLYHGSYITILTSKLPKDFGEGFFIMFAIPLGMKVR